MKDSESQTLKRDSIYVWYERATGRIVSLYSCLDAETGNYVAPSPAALRTLREDLGGDAADIDSIAVSPEAMSAAAGFRVDPQRKALIPRHQLHLNVARQEIEGDGKDATDIELEVRDASGNIVADFSGDVGVETTRGKISTPRGRVPVTEGRGRFTLTSTVETVDRVLVSAFDPSGRAATTVVRVVFR